MREPGRLKLGEVPQERPRRSERRRVPGTDAEAVQRGEREAAGQLLAGELGDEIPALPRRPEDAPVQRQGKISREDDFRRAQAPERLKQVRLSDRLEQELAGAEIDGRESHRLLAAG